MRPDNKGREGTGYVEKIRHLPGDVPREGTQRLEQAVDRVARSLASLVPALDVAGD
jgi:hypothetical protein